LTHQEDLWTAIRAGLPHDRWLPLADIYDLVAQSVTLDAEDADPQVAGSAVPRWKRNVRNVLQTRKRRGDILWDGNAGYRLPR